MLAALLVAAATMTPALWAQVPPSLPAPGDGLGLAPAPRPAAEIRPVPLPGWESPQVSGRAGGLSAPAGFAGIALVVGAAAALFAGRVRRGVAGGGAPENVDVLFVPGYGSPATGTFDELIAGIGLSPDQVYQFDYRSVVAAPDHRTAAQTATAGMVADGVAAMVADLERPDRVIYLVGFSKGGASLAHLIGQWDRNPDERPARVVGAALLDPPISNGLLGFAQSTGYGISGLPDDGGYDPIVRRFGLIPAGDSRVGLGLASGVATMVIRNPDAWLTNFEGVPDGLRVYDLEDDGPPASTLLDDGLGPFLDRVGEAHSSVRLAPDTADCIRNELWQVGACDWPGGPTPSSPPGPLHAPAGTRSMGGAGRNLVM